MRRALLLQEAKNVLKANDLGTWTRPAPGLYPHQWLWDSCFIAIGLSYIDVERARQELISLIRGQWSSGMMPHMIFDPNSNHFTGPHIWQSRLSPAAPPGIETSGITQPPVLAEAVWRVGEKMKKKERLAFFTEMYAALLRYHGWFYRDRDLHREGLVVSIHPWETGMDNTPPWIEEMDHSATPLWIKVIKDLGLTKLFELVRQDTKLVPASDRISTSVSLLLFHVQRRLRRKNYDSLEILRRSHFSINDVFVNSVLIRNNRILQDIAHELGEVIPADLRESFTKAEAALEELWSETDKRYCCRNFVTRESLNSPYIGELMPLYSGAISRQRAKQLVHRLTDDLQYWTKFPVPSVPINSSNYHHLRYWQGPAWLNTNWLLIDGLRQYGFFKEAERIKQSSLDLFEQSGSREYFSAIDGTPSGAKQFSWTAALAIDLLSEK